MASLFLNFVYDNFDFGNASFFNLDYLEREVLEVYLLVKFGEIALQLQHQTCYGVGIAFHILEDGIVELQNLVEVTKQRLAFKDKGI